MADAMPASDALPLGSHEGNLQTLQKVVNLILLIDVTSWSNWSAIVEILVFGREVDSRLYVGPSRLTSWPKRG